MCCSFKKECRHWGATKGWSKNFNGLQGPTNLSQRNRELDAKIHEALNRLFGDRLEEMLTVNILATHPAVRRQGHGGALLDAVNSLVSGVNLSLK